MVLPCGVFITTTPRAVADLTSTLSTPMPARPTTFRLRRRVQQLLRHLGGGADRQAVILADDGAQLGRRQAGLQVDLDAAAAEDVDGGGRQLVADQNFGHRQSLLRRCERADSLRPRVRPVEPGQQRLDVGGLDRRAAPDAQARRRVAIGADVVGHALLFQQRRQLLRRLGLLLRRQRREPGRDDLQADRGAGAGRRILGQEARPSRVRATQAATAARLASLTARSGRQAADALRPAQPVERVLDAQHRRRVDRLALEDALDQLAARGQAENLRQRPGGLVGLAAARPRAATARACRAPPRRPAPSARTR